MSMHLHVLTHTRTEMHRQSRAQNDTEQERGMCVCVHSWINSNGTTCDNCQFNSKSITIDNDVLWKIECWRRALFEHFQRFQQQHIYDAHSQPQLATIVFLDIYLYYILYLLKIMTNFSKIVHALGHFMLASARTKVCKSTKFNSEAIKHWTDTLKNTTTAKQQH